jgi:hypothetical protein
MAATTQIIVAGLLVMAIALIFAGHRIKPLPKKGNPVLVHLTWVAGGAIVVLVGFCAWLSYNPDDVRFIHTWAPFGR